MSDPTATPEDAPPGKRKDAASEDEESLISPELAAVVGQEMGASHAWVEAELVRRMALALEIEDPALEAALAANDCAYDLPPWTIYCISRPQRIETPGIEPWGTLLAAEELQILSPLHLGDRLDVAQQIADVQERIGGRVGHSLFISLEWRYRRMRSRPPGDATRPDRTATEDIGEEVARIRHTLAHFRERHTGE